MWFKDHQTWFFSDVNFENPSVFDLEADPLCWQNIASQAQDRVERAKDHILDDAGGVLLNYTRTATTDALGRPEFSGDR